MLAIGSSVTIVMLACFYIGVFALAICLIHSHFMDSIKRGQ
jgi:hypothetical protein